MSTGMILLVLIAAGALAIAFVGWLVTTSSSSDRARRESHEFKRMVNQPWDADSRDGRGNR